MESLVPLAPALSVAGVVVGLVALVGWITLQARFQRFARPYEALAEAAREKGSAEALQAQLLGVERNAERIAATQAYAERIHGQLETALQGIGFLKYDAFEDIRGTQSYSLCLLDAQQNGLIISSIAGRNDYRGYAKPVKSGTCDLAMSDEEKQVLGIALERLGTTTSKPAAVAATPEPAAV